MKRKIAALLAADVVGYSRLVAEDEEETLRRLTLCHGVFQDHVARVGGRIFNTAGDSILAEFPSAVDALRAAIDIQESLRTRNLAYPTSRQMIFRMGLTIGDVVEQDGDLLGDGVNIAARLQGLARPGGICLSKAMYDAVSNKLSVSFADSGLHQVKNIPNPVHTYDVVFETAAKDALQQGRKPSERPKSSANRFFDLAFVKNLGLPAALVAALVLGAAVAALTSGNFSERAPFDAERAHAPPSPTSEEHAAAGPTVTSPPQPRPAPSVTGLASGPLPPPAKQAEPTAAHVASPQPAKEADRSATAPTQSNDVAALSRMQLMRWTACKGEDTDHALTACRALIGDAGIHGGDLALAHRQLAYALRKKGEIDGAIASFTQSIDIEKSAEAFNGRGIAFQLKGEMNKAFADYDAAILFDSGNGDAFNNRAWALYKSGQMARALEDSSKAVKLIPGRAEAWDTRGHINEALGNKRQAIQDFEQALSLDSSLESSADALKRLTRN